jgi:cellulose synthase/poly-beta-1,6-N-acetylglucosamine synthase-like glycosyltransferase
MIILLLIFASLYASGLIWIALGIRNLKSRAPTEPPVFISVLVAARNESSHIVDLLQALMHQDYPANRYEVVIIDDASTDDTALKIEAVIQQSPDQNIRLVHSQDRDRVLSPKKHALAQGISAALGDILFFTDADCVPPSSWIKSMMACFTPETGMVIGLSPYELPLPKTLFQNLIALESLSLAALAAGTTGRGRPATCTGRNLAYRREVYQQVGGFKSIAHFVSGDDDLFLKLVHDRTDWRITYAMDPESVVPTRHLSNQRVFLRQRLRHASKGFHYGWKMTSTLMLVYFFNLALLFSCVSSLYHPSLDLWPWFSWLVKSAGEFVLLYRFTAPLDRSRYLWYFPLAELLHVPYVLVVGALGPIFKIQWKENQTNYLSRAAS